MAPLRRESRLNCRTRLSTAEEASPTEKVGQSGATGREIRAGRQCARMLSSCPDRLRESFDRFTRCGGRDPVARENGWTAPGQTYHREATGHRLGHDPRTLIVKTREQEHVSLFAHQP